MKNVAIIVGDEVNVEFQKNSGSRPVCRVNGKIGFIDNSHKGFIAPGSSWMVRIFLVKPNFVTVVPLIETHTAKENFDLYQEKVKTLQDQKGAKPIKDKQFKMKMLL